MQWLKLFRCLFWEFYKTNSQTKFRQFCSSWWK